MAYDDDWQLSGSGYVGAETPMGLPSGGAPTNPAQGYNVAAMGFSILGGLLKGMASLQAGNENARIDRGNADLALGSAGDARLRGAIAAQVKLLQGSQLASKQKAAFAGEGASVNSGSAVAVESDTRTISDFEARLAENQAAREAWGYEKQAANLREKANMDEASGRAGLVASILGGVTGAATYKEKMMAVT